MTFSRRDLLKTATVASLSSLAYLQGVTAFAAPTLPDKTSFGKMGVTYLNSASQHPISLASRKAVETYLSKRQMAPEAPGGSNASTEPLENFARIINAEVGEVAYTERTTAGEQMVVRGLGFPHIGGHIITDDAHFPGSRSVYDGLAKMGVAVTRLPLRNYRIELEDVKNALRPDTKLIAVSLIAMESGFEHDLKALCDIAHANGTLVYADIIQAVGCLPIDVKASGLDFAACSGYKWLMADFGIGFVFASKAAQERLHRTEFGSFGAGENMERDEYGYLNTASGKFALGTRSYTGVAMLKESLKYLLDVGIDNIHKHNQMLVNRLKNELPEIGIALHTSEASKGPYVVAGFDGIGEKVRPALERASIGISVYENRIRIAPSVFNDMDEIEHLISELKKAV